MVAKDARERTQYIVHVVPSLSLSLSLSYHAVGVRLAALFAYAVVGEQPLRAGQG